MSSTEIEQDWPANYFNFFTEIEEHFQRARGTSLFLLSPLDWALIESWKNSGIPLEAVLAGIDAAFEKWHSRKVRTRAVNSLAYCSQAVAEAAARAPARNDAVPVPSQSPFAEDEVKAHLERCSGAIRSSLTDSRCLEVAASLDKLRDQLATHLANLEELERHLSALEDKLVAAVRALQSDDELFALRQSLDREIRPYRSKMTADQLALLERRYLDAGLLERARVPRLSLFYLR